MDKYDYRRQRLIELKDNFCEGKIGILADRIGRSNSYVSRMLAPVDSPNRKRIGDDLLDVIVDAFGVTKAWLNGDETHTHLKTSIHKSHDSTVLNLYNVAASCGLGHENNQFPELIKSMEISNEALMELLGTTNLKNVELMPPDGDSMEPTIPRRSITLIKTNITEFKNSGVYLLTFDGFTYIKRLSLGKKGTLHVTSDNPKYAKSDFDIQADEMESLIIHGQFWKALPLDFLDI